MIQKTMKRQQLFELGNLDWATGDELERAQEMKSIYDQLKPEKQQEFMEKFDEYLQTDALMFSIRTNLLLVENKIGDLKNEPQTERENKFKLVLE